ncbi:hypothetical protein KGF54_001043 [Candida jiufengensis]|uniref:uncharacterized protein n=1 Tax=Candida jiufengensis TaxID=497108 RepID=UPI0022257621|nr:uncharacterized protein KGF54_001043 [Candida jiufengensis]KAI5956568.1 hypothetical protein KGF54_001043 [Candida jiufengensis]
MISKLLISYISRGLQLLFSIILLAVSAAFLGKINWNYPRVSYNIAVSVLTLIYLGYIISISGFLKNQTWPLLIIIIEFVFWIFYLAAWASIADFMWASDCGNYYYSDTKTACQLYKSILPFGLFNWILFSIDLIFITIYIIIPYIKNGIFNHSLQPKEFIWGSIFLNGEVATDVVNRIETPDEEQAKAELESEPSQAQAPTQANYTNTTTEVQP